MSRDSKKPDVNNREEDIPRTLPENNNDTDDQLSVPANAGVDPRQAALDDLVKRRREERSPEDEQDAADQEATQQEGGAEHEHEQEREKDEQGEKVFRLKVDGQEVEKPESWMVANAQKLLAGDRRMAEAAGKERQLQQWEHDLRQREQSLTQQQSKPPAEPGASDDVMAGISEALEGIYSGDDDRAKKALANLLGRQQPTQQISQEDIDRRAREAAASTVTQIEEQRRLSEATKRFETEFNDIASDPFLTDLADRYSAELLVEQPELEPYQNLELAGKKAREWLKTRTGGAEMSARAQRKRQAMGTVAGANRAMSLGKDEPPPKSRRDVLDGMKRARGQQF